MKRLGICFGSAVLLAFVSIGAVAPGAHATFPGRNGLIVFDGSLSGGSQIFTVRPDGSNLRQLTHVPKTSGAGNPSWSADGRLIAYCVERTPGSDCEARFGAPDARVWVMNWDGSNQHQVTHDPNYADYNPSWSPDGHHIVFSRCSHFFRTCDIDVMRPDGTHIRMLIGGYWHHTLPVYSPDGSQIAFMSDKGGYDERIWVGDADGSHLRAITPPRLVAVNPAWTPDGSAITFAGPISSNSPHLWSVAPDGSHRHIVTRRFATLSASYAPNGRKIVVTDYSQNIPGCRCGGLVLVNPDGTGLVPVVTTRQVPDFGSGIDWGVAR